MIMTDDTLATAGSKLGWQMVKGRKGTVIWVGEIIRGT